ncbi:MAG: formyltetrahydrofolate deformylase [Marinobacterium sp.]|nr:formyltetrahydrofolate deformylase [Marinobacterium sp.]
MSETTPTWILTATCPSRLGTVDVVTRFLFENQCYVTEMHTFDDTDNGNFFIRAEFRANEEAGTDERINAEQLNETFAEHAARFDMQWQIRDTRTPERVVIMVSKFDHCLQDLLYRYSAGQLNIEIPAIISNHPDLKELADWHNIPYYHFPITAETKPEQEARVMTVVENTQADLVVLARYMQVLSDDLCKKLEGRAINIHHSLLPGFKGARPYHQAYDKGVKLVGATAHYVSPDLDEGPIITQGVEPVDHSFTPAKLAAKGRDIERITLFKAVKMHCERRVFLDGNRTVIFQN